MAEKVAKTIPEWKDLMAEEGRKTNANVTITFELEEGGHRRKKNWVQAMIRMGWTIYNIPMHAKVAILEQPGRSEEMSVFLSSNNWQAGGNHEFIELIEDPDVCMDIKLRMKEALGNLNPIEPA